MCGVKKYTPPRFNLTVFFVQFMYIILLCMYLNQRLYWKLSLHSKFELRRHQNAVAKINENPSLAHMALNFLLYTMYANHKKCHHHVPVQYTCIMYTIQYLNATLCTCRSTMTTVYYFMNLHTDPLVSPSSLPL